MKVFILIQIVPALLVLLVVSPFNKKWAYKIYYEHCKLVVGAFRPEGWPLVETVLEEFRKDFFEE
jgi:hypothetical protein